MSEPTVLERWSSFITLRYVGAIVLSITLAVLHGELMAVAPLFVGLYWLTSRSHKGRTEEWAKPAAQKERDDE